MQSTKVFAIQRASGAVVSLDDLHLARPHIGHVYFYRPNDDAPFLMVCNPHDYLDCTAWLEANGWAALPHVMDTGTSIEPDHHALLVKHAASVLPTDNTVQAMKKIAEATGMRCFHPFR